MPGFFASLSPATRSSWIIGGLFAVFILITAAGVLNKARSIRREREQTRALNSQTGGGEMIWIPTGKMTMGAVDGAPDEQPMRDVKISGFFMDRTEVTNEQFARFVAETGYVTLAERPDSTGGWVFQMDAAGSRWERVRGATWRNPDGSTPREGREKFPVVQVAWEDAAAFARWSGKRLPSEAEWEFAARGGAMHLRFPWGNDLTPGGHYFANFWQGPLNPATTAADGFAGLAPAGSFRPNDYDLADLTGNAWEWTADWYRADYYVRGPRKDPPGPAESLDPDEPAVPKRVARGGSYLSSETNGAGYRTSARRKIAPDYCAADLGFRCARSAQ